MPIRFAKMTRFKAFTIHLGISATIIALIMVLFIWQWFPLPFFITEGGWRGLRLIAVVDCIVGPLITLIIFNKNKPHRELFTDLVVIGMLQAMAMGGGLLTVSSQRIVAAVYSDGGIYPLNADEALRIGGKLTELIKSSPTSPAYVVVDLPDGYAERKRLRLNSMSTDASLYAMEELMVPLGDSAREELSQIDESPLKLTGLKDKKPIEDYLRETSHSKDDSYFVPTISCYESFITVISRKDLTVTGWIRGTYD